MDLVTKEWVARCVGRGAICWCKRLKDNNDENSFDETASHILQEECHRQSAVYPLDSEALDDMELDIDGYLANQCPGTMGAPKSKMVF